MGYTIRVSGNKKYIIITVRGEINRASAMKQNIEAHALGNKLGISKYLVDVTEAVNTGSIKDNYDFAYSDMISTPVVNKSARVALLASCSDHSHDFVETVSRNAGLNVTLFRHSELAIQHLLKE